jgi:protein involved in polysaccharide export with SLBB domain
MKTLIYILAASAVLNAFGAEPLKSDVAKAGQSGKPDYLLSPGDKLSITIDQDPAPGRPVDVLVLASGELEVPVSRCCESTITIPAKGRPLKEVENDLKTKLEEDFYHKATVQLRLIDPTRKIGQVWLRGAVKGNIVQLDPGKPKTLWEALTQVGTSEFANLSKVRIERIDPATGQTKEIFVDIKAVEKGERNKDVELQDGDRITVKEKWFNF